MSDEIQQTSIIERTDVENALAQVVLVDVSQPIENLTLANRSAFILDAVSTIKACIDLFPSKEEDLDILVKTSMEKYTWYKTWKPEFPEIVDQFVLGSVLAEDVPGYGDLFSILLYKEDLEEIAPLNRISIDAALFRSCCAIPDVGGIIRHIIKGVPLVFDNAVTLFDLAYPVAVYQEIVNIIKDIAKQYPVKYN